MFRAWVSIAIISALLGACASAPAPRSKPTSKAQIAKPLIPKPGRSLQTALPDRSYFHQQDRRWADVKIGASGSRLAAEGCLVTAAAMALSNLGFVTDPGDLTHRLSANDGFTSRGWLVWQGLERVTGGQAKTRFYRTADTAHVRQCLADGYYPLVKFSLDSRRSHWALVVGESEDDFYLRDPMVAYATPIPLSSRASGISAVRCVGLS